MNQATQCFLVHNAMESKPRNTFSEITVILLFPLFSTINRYYFSKKQKIHALGSLHVHIMHMHEDEYNCHYARMSKETHLEADLCNPYTSIALCYDRDTLYYDIHK